jgi:hypothetical protein
MKVGRTKDIHRRCGDYPKGSQLLCCWYVLDVVQTETKILEFFRKKYKNRLDIGREYFEGDISSMTKDIMNLIQMPYSRPEIIDFFKVHDITPVAEEQSLHDKDMIIKEFVDENIGTLDGIVLKSADVYNNFMTWLSNTPKLCGTRTISHKRFIQGLKNIYCIVIKPHMFDDGCAASLKIQGPNSVPKVIMPMPKEACSDDPVMTFLFHIWSSHKHKVSETIIASKLLELFYIHLDQVLERPEESIKIWNKTKFGRALSGLCSESAGIKKLRNMGVKRLHGYEFSMKELGEFLCTKGLITANQELSGITIGTDAS